MRLHARIFTTFTLCILSLANWANAQSTQPAGKYDTQPVRSARSANETVPTTSPSSATLTVPTSGFDMQRVALALGLVLVLIFAMRYAGKHWLGASAATGAGKLVRVLGRTTTGPRQQIVILQVGKRIVVAADNAGQMCSLCQITEADEVASLLGQLDDTSTAPRTSGFSNWFKPAQDEFEQPDADEAMPATAGATVGRAMDEPSLESARTEIASLMDKVRGMARQFKK